MLARSPRRPWLIKGWRGLCFCARAVAALGVIGLWAYSGLPVAWAHWLGAIQTPSAAGLSYEEQRAGLPEGALNVLMAVALRECRAQPRLLLLSDEPVAWMQGSYLLYPRRIDVIQSVDGLTSADLDTHAGGCLAWYRSQEARLSPFRARLSETRCLPEGCLYRVRE